MSLKRKILTAAGLLILVGGVAVVAVVRSTPELNWRASVLLSALKGDTGDLGLAETLRWIKPGSPVYLENLKLDPNPYVSINNPYTDKASREAGRSTYFEACAKCHGQDAKGGTGPSLVDPRGAASDWAMFRTIRRGVTGTAMLAQPLDERKTWEVIAFLRSYLSERNASVGAAPTRALLSGVGLESVGETVAGDEWPIFSGSYAGWRHSTLARVTTDNVWQLSLAWMHQIDSNETMVETTPLVVDDVMYATEPPNAVVALDAQTGETLWRYRRRLPDGLVLCCGSVNRGVAMREKTLFLGTLDAHLVALDAASGRVLWDTEVAREDAGYSITSAPLVAGKLVITGVGGGEFGISGFLAAYDADTGEQVWRFDTIPKPGEPHAETWAGGQATGGVPTWGTGTYDSDLDLVYWGAGHPAPDFNGDQRAGDNLYSNSLLAMRASTGELAWHFQFTPHDEWDWDATQIPVLVDRDVAGEPRRLVLFANRNGFYYVLDRETGAFVNGTPFARQNWADGLDADGRPRVREDARPSTEGTLVYPGVTGATNWWPPSYSPQTGMIYIPVLEKANVFFKWPQEYQKGQLFLGGVARPIAGYKHYTGVRALDPLTGERRWEMRFGERGGWSHVGGLLTTAGNLLFVGDNRTFYAADARTGETLWRVPMGGGINAAPMSYQSGGRQFIAMAAGRALLAFALPADATADGGNLASGPQPADDGAGPRE